MGIRKWHRERTMRMEKNIRKGVYEKKMNEIMVIMRYKRKVKGN